MIRSSRPFIYLLPVAAIGAWLLWLAPSRLWAIDTGIAGSVILSISAWIGISLASRGHEPPGQSLSGREQQAWVGLAFLVTIYAYFLSHIGLLGNAVDLRSDPHAHAIGRNIAVMVIAWIVIADWLRRRREGEITADERDHQIAARADAFGNGALVFCLIAFVVMIGFTPAERLAWLTPMRTAVMLLNLLILRAVLEAGALVILYWRDRR